MLSLIREKLKGWVAYLIIGLIIVPFALFGINQYFLGETNVVVASVGDLEINKNDYLKQYQRQKKPLIDKLGDEYTDQIDKTVKNRALNTLISQYLIQNQVNEFDFLTTNKELQQSLLQQEVFQEDGLFSFDKYKQVLELNGYSISRFETEEKQRLASRQLSQALFTSSFIDKKQLNLFLKIKNQLRKFDYLIIDSKNYLDEVIVEKTSIEDVYQKNKQQFIEPEKVKVSYISLDAKDLEKNIKVTKEQLLSLYENEQESFSIPEERAVAHILFKNETKAKKILTQLKKKPQTFAKLAKSNSIDEDSSQKGGELGFFSKGIMEESFDDALFNLNKNEVSEVIETESGFHILKLLKIKKSKKKTFESVKKELTKLFKEQQVKKKLNDLNEKLAELTYDNPESLKIAAKTLNLKIETSPWISKKSTTENKINSLFYNAKFIKAAFSPEVLISKENSNVVEISENQLVVVRLLKHKKSRQKSLKEVQKKIKKQIAKILTIQYVEKLGQDITEKFNDKSKLNKYLKKNKLTWKSATWTDRLNKDINSDILNIAFQTNKKIGSFNGQLLKDTYGFVVLKGIKNGKTLDDDEISYQDNLLSIENEVRYLNILKSFQEKTNIEIFSKSL